jgi:hypothetical protein
VRACVCTCGESMTLRPAAVAVSTAAARPSSGVERRGDPGVSSGATVVLSNDETYLSRTQDKQVREALGFVSR